METKVKDIRKGGGAWRKYRAVVHGDVSFWRVLRDELLVLLFTNVPGILGLALRRIFFPCMFGKCGRKVVFGRGVAFRHASKISLGDGVMIDDGAMLDAKGDGDSGITLEDGVFIGRFSKLYCKGGRMLLKERANVSSNCTLYSNNSLTIGKGCMVGAYTYILSGGEYDWRDPAPYAEQSGMCTKGPLVIGDDCWIGARATILDGAQSVGDRALVAACALVNKPVPPRTIVGGVPAKAIGQC